jgi:hypothetical protein
MRQSFLWANSFSGPLRIQPPFSSRTLSLTGFAFRFFGFGNLQLSRPPRRLVPAACSRAVTPMAKVYAARLVFVRLRSVSLGSFFTRSPISSRAKRNS